MIIFICHFTSMDLGYYQFNSRDMGYSVQYFVTFRDIGYFEKN